MGRAREIELLEQKIRVEDFIVYATIDQEIIEFFDELPSAFVGHTRLLLAGYKGAGQISEFIIHEPELEHVWKMVNKRGIRRPITFELGIGVPKLLGIKIDTSPLRQGERHILVSCNGPIELLRDWHPRWLELTLNQRVNRQMGTESWFVNPSEVYGMWYRAAVYGRPINEYQIGRKVAYNLEKKGKAYWVRGRQKQGDIEVLLGEISKVKQEDLMELIQKDIERVIARMASGPFNTGIYKILEKKLISEISNAYTGLPYLKLNTPYSFLAAFRVPLPPADEQYDPVVGMLALRSIQHKVFDLTPQRKGVLEHVGLKDQIVQSCEYLAEHKIVQLRKDRYQLAPNVRVVGYNSYLGDIQKYCSKSLELSKTALTKVRAENRDYRALLIDIPEELANRLFMLIQSFKEDSLEEIKAGKNGEAFQFNLQMVPLTRLHPLPVDQLPNDVKSKVEEKFWCHLILREMVGLKGSKNNAAWFASRLYPEATLKEIQFSLKHIEKCGFVRRDAMSGKFVQTNRELLAESTRYKVGANFHMDLIDFALSADRWEIQERSEIFSTCFFATPDSLARFKERYGNLLNAIFKLANTVSQRDQIYQLSVQLYNLN